jgi:hypothetical protein
MPAMMTLGSLFYLAATKASAWEALQRIPKQAWINLALSVLVVLVVVRTWRTLKRLNDYAPFVALTLLGGLIFCYWVYERSEPRFLTPVVNIAAEFLPTKNKQAQNIEKLRQAREADKPGRP